MLENNIVNPLLKMVALSVVLIFLSLYLIVATFAFNLDAENKTSVKDTVIQNVVIGFQNPFVTIGLVLWNALNLLFFAVADICRFLPDLLFLDRFCSAQFRKRQFDKEIETVSNYLCIDVGGTFIKYAIGDHLGKISSKDKETTPATLDGFLSVIRKIVSENIEDIDGIAICCPGKVDRKEGMIFHGGSLQYLDGLPLKTMLEAEFHLPVGVVNDGKAAASRNYGSGICGGCDNGVAIVPGTAIGGGIIANGQLLEGEHFKLANLVFIVHNPREHAAKTLIETRLSAVAFVETVHKKSVSLRQMASWFLMQSMKGIKRWSEF